MTTHDPSERSPGRRSSKREQAEESLRLIEFSVNHAIDQIFWATEEGKIAFVNDAMCEQLGYTREELLQMDLWSFDPSPPSIWREAWEKIKREKSLTLETVHIAKDGREIPVYLSANYIEYKGKEYNCTVARDITEHKAAEKQLRLTEFSMNRVADMMSWIGPEGRFLFVNDSICRSLGYTREELLDMTVWDLDPNILDSWDERWQESKKHESLTFESTHLTKTGEVRPVEVTTSYIEFEGQEYLLALSHDIGERKRAEDLLRDEVSRRRMLVQQSKDGIVVLDRDGKVYEANEAYARMLGYSMEEVYQLYVWDWDTQFSHEELLGMLESVDETGAHFQTRHRRKDGTQCEVEISTNGTTYGGEKFIFCICRDITESRRAAEALRASEDRYQNLVNLSPDAIVVQTDGKYVFANPAAATLFGAGSPQEIVGRDMLELVHPDYRELIAIRAPQAPQPLAGGVAETAEIKVLRLDGSPVTVETSVAKIEFDGRPATQVVFRDITDRIRAEDERLQLERQLQHSQKLESLGVLAGGIAHDFNNILTSVLGNAELALSQLSPSAPARENLLEITASSRRAAALCRQMLAYSGRGHFVTEAIDLRALVEDMLDLLKATISKKALLKLDLSENLPPMHGDASQISQVIMNLVLNASEAIGEQGGVIAISTGSRECSSKYLAQTYANENLAPGLYLSLEVSDTGAGMDEATQERIFEPFFTTKFTGRGLGLAAVLGIVRGHKGALRLHSEVGKGTTFEILFPASDADAASLAHKNGAAKSDWHGEGTVLLVDDEETIRTLGARILTSLGFTVLTATDGCEALALYAEHRDEIRLVLLDLTMPRMDGEEAFRELRLIDPGVRVVMSSGYAESDIASRFASKGLVGFVHKPYSLAELTAQLQTALAAPR